MQFTQIQGHDKVCGSVSQTNTFLLKVYEIVVCLCISVCMNVKIKKDVQRSQLLIRSTVTLTRQHLLTCNKLTLVWKIDSQMLIEHNYFNRTYTLINNLMSNILYKSMVSPSWRLILCLENIPQEFSAITFQNQLSVLTGFIFRQIKLTEVG